MKTLLTVCLLIAVTALTAQVPYTQNRFAIDSVQNHVYGSDTDYAGNPATLKMDIYKPIGDSNCLRPIMIMMHGGAWIGGSKEDYNMAYMSRELAKKGWVVANINYRLGTHKTSNYNMYALCNTSLSQPCGYICDSAEIYRANFRAMQDAKGAIRYMKSRHSMDSTDIDNVYICGESAGGFIALAAAYTDKNAEKDSNCFAIANAPNPDADMATYGCVPGSLNLSRPDLGSIEGKLHRGTYDAKVKGAGNFYGGLLKMNILDQVSDTPRLYMFHQGSDVVVHYTRGALLGRTSYECYGPTNICQPYYFYPVAYGSRAIAQYNASAQKVGLVSSNILMNYNYQNNCFSNGHAIDNINTRLSDMTLFFANGISATGNDPAVNCKRIGLQERHYASAFTPYPNPAASTLHTGLTIPFGGLAYTISDHAGKTLLSGILHNDNVGIDLSVLPAGYYILRTNTGRAAGFSVMR